MPRFLSGKDYPYLCTKCQLAVDNAFELFVLGLMPDTDDPEAPMMYAWDHGWLHRDDYACDKYTELHDGA